MSEEPVEVKPDSPRLVAVVGEIAFAGRAVAVALQEAGVSARVLCPDAAAEAAINSLPHQERIETVRGDLSSAEALTRALTGAAAVIFVSPITMNGRIYRAGEHLEDVRRVLHAAETLMLRKIVYHSSVGASPTANAQALRDAFAAEELLEKSRCEDYRVRTGPLMGHGDGFLSEIAAHSRRGSPVMTLMGYGGTLVQPLEVNDFAHSLASIVADTQGTLRNGVFDISGPETRSLLELTDSSLELAKRAKLKVHVPLFVLQLVSGMSGKAFKERVGLLFDTLAVEKNEIPQLLGMAVKLKNVKQVQESLQAV